MCFGKHLQRRHEADSSPLLLLLLVMKIAKVQELQCSSRGNTAASWQTKSIPWWPPLRSVFVLVNFESQLQVDLPPASSLPKTDCITCQLYNLHRNGQCIRHGGSGILVVFYTFSSVVSAFPIESRIRCMILFVRPHSVSCLLLRPMRQCLLPYVLAE